MENQSAQQAAQQAAQQGVMEIYTTDPHDPFVRFKTTRDDFKWSSQRVRREQILRPLIGDTTAHIFPEHVTAITFTPTKENN